MDKGTYDLTSISVGYTRTGPDRAIEGTIRLLLPEDADWKKEWGTAYEALRQRIDTAFSLDSPDALLLDNSSGPAEPKPEPDQAAEDATEEVSQDEYRFVANEPVEFTGCRVMYDPYTLEAQGKRREQVRMRIGNKEQIKVGSKPGYVNAKSIEPDMMKLLLNFRPGDHVDIKGYFEEPWRKKGKNGQPDVDEYDLVVQEIVRVV